MPNDLTSLFLSLAILVVATFAIGFAFARRFGADMLAASRARAERATGSDRVEELHLPERVARRQRGAPPHRTGVRERARPPRRVA